ncbi:MSC_0619 family F1-like ATPase alpha subunit [Mycoplasma struthionis]|uniref:ATP F0F1 synthase subunit alpha n=1 Tax=Mycoplasma struthionis TaxID=538220 RepID=A0A3G8LG37_9MOLU|nr:ATP F0F1 synthase subunit alpha [Mycoplasma struthionis]AZG68619.1 ATP F0F1 synthase subunit alpha [Mycoplasma struthionis]
MAKENKLIITAIFDYVIEVTGNNDYQQNQMFALKDNKNAQLLLISASENKAFCLSNGDINDFAIGKEVIEIENTNTVQTSLDYLGKIIDIKNNILFPLVKEQPKKFLKYNSQIFNTYTKLLDYEPLTDQLKTGYVLTDLLIPIGKGQRELIIGNRKTGKTHIALNAIINQKNQNVKCVYVAIGQQHSQVSAIYEMLKANGALDYTMIVAAKSDNPYDQYLAPYVAMAHAENLSYESDVLIVFDDLTAHANIFREIALLTNKPVGKEAFPGDMFFAHSRLLERSGKFKNRKSITALPILQIIDNDITSLIASNVISITDGQLVTNDKLFALNYLPAIDVDLSVSRIGGAVQKEHISRIAHEVGKIFRAYKRQTKLASLKYDLNDETKALINKGQLIENMFIQKGVSIYSDENMYLMSKLISWNIFSDVKDIEVAIKFLEALFATNELANEVFKKIMANSLPNETKAKEYFAFVLRQYGEYKNLGWKINIDKEFVRLSDSEIQAIENIMEAK